MNLLLATTEMSDSDACAIGLSFLLVYLILNLMICAVPGVIATMRNHPKQKIIWLVSMLLGWTGVAWIIALCWSFNNDKQS